MNLCKSSGISARTKSLRERFSSKRSYSELSFAAPSTSTSSLATSEASSSRAGSFRRTRSSRQHGPPPATSSNASAYLGPGVRGSDSTSRPGGSGGSGSGGGSSGPGAGGGIGGGDSFNSYLPEDAYCSALDINCQLDGEPRFPWQRDVAIQCDLMTLPRITVDTSNESGHLSNLARMLPGGKSGSSYTGSKKSSSTVFSSFISKSSSSHHQQPQVDVSYSMLQRSNASLPSPGHIGQVESTGGGGGQSPSHVIAHPANAHLILSSATTEAIHSGAGDLLAPTIITSGGSLSNLLSTSPIPSITTPKKSSHPFSSLRFWKSSSPLPSDQGASGGGIPNASVQIHPPSPSKKRILPSPKTSKTKHKSVLQRAVSFDSRGGGYSKLISNDSIVSLESINQVNAALAAASSDTGTSSETVIVTTSNVEGTSSNTNSTYAGSVNVAPNVSVISGLAAVGGGGPFSLHQSNNANVMCELLSPSKSEMTIINQKSASGFTGHHQYHHPHHYQGRQMTPSPLPSTHVSNADGTVSANVFDSAPESRLQSPPRSGSTKPGTPEFALRSDVKEKRNLYFNRRQPSSAPDSFDDGDSSPSTPTSEDTRTDHIHHHRHRQQKRATSSIHHQQNVFTFDTMQKLFDLKLRAKASENSPANLDQMTRLNTNPSEIVASVAASVAAGTSGPSSYVTKPSLLDIPGSGLTAGSGGKGVHGYMSLPSPNVQSEGHDANPVFKKLSGLGDESEREEEAEPAEEEPPASILVRRQALVPPKLITDDYESANEDIDTGLSGSGGSTGRGSDSLDASGQLGDGGIDGDGGRSSRGSNAPGSASPGGNRHSPNLLAEPRDKRDRRRSSIVVIPPMQICPGDLLVYSKVINSKNASLFADHLDGSTQCLASAEDANRKGKNTWSLLKLFDRSNRGKSDSLCGLEEVLSNLTPSVFVDEQLSKYKGLTWYEFLSMYEDRRASSFVSGHRISHPTSDTSRRSSGQSSTASNAAPAAASASDKQPIATSSSSHQANASTDLRRIALQRHQTFDSSITGTVTSDPVGGGVTAAGDKTSGDAGGPNSASGLMASSAHSKRSHSCIAPVDISIRRLSGGVNLIEESSFDLESEKKSDQTSPLAKSPEQKAPEQGLTATSGGADPPVGSPPSSGGVVGPASGPNQVASGNTSGTGETIPSAVAATVAAAFTCSSASSSTRSSFAISRSEQKRREALWDLFQSECVFLYDHLMVLKNVFMEPLKKIQVEGFAMFAEPEVLFGNLDELCCVTYAFCKEFLNVLLHQMNAYDINATDALVKLFQKSSKAASLTQAYHRYTLNYINALNYLETLRRQVEFNEFEKWCSRDPRCKKLQLTDLLVSPVQHVMRVPLILKDIESRTEDLQERETITAIIEAEEASLRELDDKMKWLKNFERLLEIQRNIQWPPVIDLDPKVYIPDFLKPTVAKQPCEHLIVTPRRQIILEGPLNLLDSGKPVEMYLILFDDMFIITRRKKGLSKKQSSLTEKWATSCGKSSASSMGPHDSLFKYVVYKQALSLDRFYIHDVSEKDATASNLKSAFVLVCLNRFQQIITCHTFQAPNDAVKLMWLTKLRDTADKWKRTLQNSVFRSQQRLSTASTMSGSSCVQQSTRSSSICTNTTTATITTSEQRTSKNISSIK